MTTEAAPPSEHEDIPEPGTLGATPSSADAPEESAGGADSGPSGKDKGQTLDEPAASESYSAFVKCDTVKP